MVVAWGIAAAVLPGVVAAAGHDTAALLLLVVVVPFAGALRLRTAHGASRPHALRVTSGVMLGGLGLLFLEYWAASGRHAVDRSQWLGLAVAGLTGITAAGGGTAVGGWLHRRTARRAAARVATAPPLQTATPDRVGRECPVCGVCEAPDARRCPADGSVLQAMPTALTLADRYRLTRRLGRGGMGTVYEAYDATLDRPVAIKLVHRDLAGLPGARPQTDREARAAARFNHPNVVTVFDYGTSGGVDYIVMERLVGHSLREQLRSEERIAPAHAFAILHDVARAVDAAHRQQWLHLDLKPENVFLVRDAGGSRAKVLDFGLAQWLGLSPTAPAADTTAMPEAPLIGTPAYMAPERLRGESLDYAVDLWALAVMAFEMLTGALPFAAVTRQADVFVDQPPPSADDTGAPSARTPASRLPAAARAGFARALTIDRAARPHSAGALVDDLERSWYA